jgi:hypothetical protein
VPCRWESTGTSSTRRSGSVSAHLALSLARGYGLRTNGKGRLRLELTTYVGFMPFTQIAEMIKLQ